MKRGRVLITGGAGYLGNVITRKFLDEGFEVACLDNLMYRQDQTIFPLAGNPNFEFIYGDVRDEDLLKETVPGFDVILPLAAIVGAPACKRKPFEAQSINREAIFKLNDIRGKDQKMIFPNTNSGYGTRSSEIYCTEETPLEPISLYGKTKCEAEESILNSSKDSVVFRLASVFGISPRMRLELSFHDMVCQAVSKGGIVLSEGYAKRNFIHIGDISNAFLFAVNNYGEMVDKKVYNLGSDGANISRRSLAEKVVVHLPGTVIYEDTLTEDPDKRNYIVSNDRLKQAGFEATTSLDQGISEVIKGYRISSMNDPHRNT